MEFVYGVFKMKKRAFTLVELLVVISIIALMLAVLMPTLGKAREMARTLVCQTNLKSLGTSWQAYASDNSGNLVCAMTMDGSASGDVGDPLLYAHTQYSWVWKPYDADNDFTYANPLYTVINIPIEHRQKGIKNGKLFPYSADVGVYHCPSENSKFGHYRSYSIADGMYGEMAFMPLSNTFRWKSHTKLSQIKRPVSKYVFVEDNEARPYNEGSWKPVLNNDPTNPYILYDPLVIRHARSSRSCYAFADGHAEQRSWSVTTRQKFESQQKEGNYMKFDVYAPQTDDGKEDIRWLYSGWTETWR
jgi:prepilin-type N-terminal cleavage/methylation domain-containing protein